MVLLIVNVVGRKKIGWEKKSSAVERNLKDFGKKESFF